MDTSHLSIKTYEPRHEEICLRGFRPGTTQTPGCHGTATEILDLGRRGIVLLFSENNGAADQRLCFCICKSRFSHDVTHMILVLHVLVYEEY